MFNVSNLASGYGQSAVIHDINLSVAKEEIVAVMGRNGMGKTTLFKTLMGILPLRDGSIKIDGVELGAMESHQRVSRGVAYVPQGRMIFPGMTVLENLEMGAYTRRDKAEITKDLAMVFDLFPRLHERRKQAGGTLSGGEQQMLAVGRALMTRPKLLLLDEPSMGLAPKLIQQIFEIITRINEQGTTILLVEQNAQQALSRAHRGYVLETGRIVKEGTGQELLHDPAVKEAYLGVA